MKKAYIVLGILVIGLLTSCIKDNSSPASNKDLSIKASVDNLDTKTTYNKSGSTYEFSWVTNDVISVMLIDGESNRDRYAYKTTEETPGASTTFNPNGSLDSKWSPAEYAFYPANTNGFTYPNNTANPSLTLGDNTVTQANPYSAIPMIGTNNGDNTFSFKAATGVLKVTFTNLPSALVGNDLTLELVTGQNGGSTHLKGVCTFPGDNKTLAITSEGNAQKAVTMSVTDASSVTFFVPIPACTIAAKDMKLALKSSAMASYFSGAGYFFNNFVNPSAITISRGVVSELPTIDYSSIGETLTFTGTPAAPKVTLVKGPRVSRVQYVVATTEAAGVTAFGTSYEELTTNGETTVAAPASTGAYYIVYRLVNPEGGYIKYGSIPFAYVAAAADLAGTYKVSANTSFGFIIAASDDANYDVMMTQYISTSDTYNGISGKVYGTWNATTGELSFAKDQKLGDYYVCSAENISTSTAFTPDDNLVFQLKNQIGASNKLVFYCGRKFGIAATGYVGTGQQFNPDNYLQQ